MLETSMLEEVLGSVSSLDLRAVIEYHAQVSTCLHVILR